MISENIISTYNNELNWVRETRQKLFENEVMEEKDKMNYQIREIESKKYIELISTTEPLSTENDALDLVALCWEHETYALMIHYAALSEDFFKLKTKLDKSTTLNSTLHFTIIRIVLDDTMKVKLSSYITFFFP